MQWTWDVDRGVYARAADERRPVTRYGSSLGTRPFARLVWIHGCTPATSDELTKEKLANQQKGLETKLQRICNIINVQSKVRGGMALGLAIIKAIPPLPFDPRIGHLLYHCRFQFLTTSKLGECMTLTVGRAYIQNTEQLHSYST